MIEHSLDALAFVQSKIDGLPKALPSPAPTPHYLNPDNRLDQLFSAVKFHAQAIKDNQRDIYDIIKAARGNVLNAPDAKRSMYINMHTTMDRLFYSLDYGIEAAEAHAKSMCVLSRV